MLRELKQLEYEKQLKTDEYIKMIEDQLEDIYTRQNCSKADFVNVVNAKIVELEEEYEKLTAKKAKNITYRFILRPNSKLNLEINRLIRTISQLKMSIEQRETLNSKLLERTATIAREIDAKKSIKDLGISFQEARKILKEKNVPLILEETDKFLIDNPESYAGLEDFVLVHKTRYIPEDGLIKTRKGTGLTSSTSLASDKIGTLEYAEERNTIHFSVNGEVSSHSYGNWEDCQYAIITPFVKMPPNQLRSGAVMDTYFEGDVNLPNEAIILCPKSEIELVRSKNPNQLVVGYQGENVKGYADAMVGILGHHIEQIGMWDWYSSNSAKYYEMLRNIIPNVNTTPHIATKEREEEMFFEKVNKFNAFNKKLIESKLDLSRSEYFELQDSANVSLFAVLGSDSYSVLAQRVRESLSSCGAELRPEFESELLELSKRIEGSDMHSDVLNPEEKLRYEGFLKERGLGERYFSQYDYRDFFIKDEIYKTVREKQKNTQSEFIEKEQSAQII